MKSQLDLALVLNFSIFLQLIIILSLNSFLKTYKGETDIYGIVANEITFWKLITRVQVSVSSDS